jgi:hypothetical protein
MVPSRAALRNTMLWWLEVSTDDGCVVLFFRRFLMFLDVHKQHPHGIPEVTRNDPELDGTRFIIRPCKS